MEIYPFGFLSELFFLVTPGRDRLDDEGGPQDYSDADEGELLAPPQWLEALTEGELEGGRAFLGLESQAGSTLAEIRPVAGAEVMDALQDAGGVYGMSDETWSHLLASLIGLSNRLQGLHEQGVRLVNAQMLEPLVNSRA